MVSSVSKIFIAFKVFEISKVFIVSKVFPFQASSFEYLALEYRLTLQKFDNLCTHDGQRRCMSLSEFAV